MSSSSVPSAGMLTGRNLDKCFWTKLLVHGNAHTLLAHPSGSFVLPDIFDWCPPPLPKMSQALCLWLLVHWLMCPALRVFIFLFLCSLADVPAVYHWAVTHFNLILVFNLFWTKHSKNKTTQILVLSLSVHGQTWAVLGKALSSLPCQRLRPPPSLALIWAAPPPLGSAYHRMALP